MRIAHKLINCRFSIPMFCTKVRFVYGTCTVLLIFIGFIYFSDLVRNSEETIRVHKEIGYGRMMMKVPMDEDYPDEVCSDYACRDQLNNYEKLLYMQCLVKVQVAVGTNNTEENSCRFLVTHSRKPVALISFPGSGNTWVRQLLEGSSGVCTGSVMCDMSLRFDGFIGENINSGSTLVVKTHKPTPTWITGSIQSIRNGEPNAADAAFESAIIIIRNPLNALVSEWNRRVMNDFQTKTIYLHTHTKKAEERHFRENSMWNDFVKQGSKKWQNTIQNWVIKGRKIGRRILVVYYEDIKKDPNGRTKQMLNFLGVNSEKKMEMDYNKFHRDHNNSSRVFNPYTSEQKQLVLNTVKDTVKEIKQNKLSSAIDLTRYLPDY